MIILAVGAATSEPRLENFILCELVISYPTLSAIPPWTPESFPVDKAIEIGIPFNWCIYRKVLSKIVFDYVVVLITKTHAWLCNNERSLVLKVFNVPWDYILFCFLSVHRDQNIERSQLIMKGFSLSHQSNTHRIAKHTYRKHIWSNCLPLVNPGLLVEVNH